MSQKFSEKSVSTIVVDPSGSVRTLMGDVLKSQGFKTVQGVGSLADALGQLETESVDWLVIPLCHDQEINALQVLRLCLEVPELQHVRVSLLLEENEMWCLGKAFELGLLSWHVKPFTKVSLGADIEKLIKRLESHSWNLTHTSAEYLREYLSAQKDTKSQLSFARSMLDVFPGNPDLLAELSKAQLAAGNTDQAKAALSQAIMLDPAKEDIFKNLATQLFGADGLKPGEGAAEAINAMGIKSCVIVDSDDTIRQAVTDTLKGLGVPEIHDFADGQSAWDHLEKNPPPSLLIMEWRIPKITGPLLIQRVRHHGMHEVPIVLVSSLIKTEDMPLIREIGIAAVVAKPVEKSALLSSLVWTVQQDRLPTEAQSMERKIRVLLAARKNSEAQELAGRFLQTPNLSTGKKLLIESELAFATGNFTLSRDLAVQAIRSSNENINLLNILAKSFMQLSDYANALKCFERAQKLAPMNIERLCMIAEAQVEVGEEDKAKEAMDKASQIDPDATQVKEATAKMAVFSGNVEIAKALMGELESLSNVLSYMNNKAIANARCGRYDEGLELYTKTISSIPDDRKDLVAIVRYNMALAKIRGGDLEGGIKELDESMRDPNSRVYKKAQSLHKRTKKALETGGELTIKDDDKSHDTAKTSGGPEQKTDTNGAEPTTQSELHESIVASVAPRKGDICCYMIFTFLGNADDRVKNSLAKNPKFKRRKAIERDESMGVEKAKKIAG